MAIDPNIALGVRGIELPNQLAQYGQLAQIQSAQNQNQLAQYQLSAAQRQEASQNALSDAYKSAFNPETGAVDNAMILKSLASAGAGHMIPDVQAKLFKAEQEKAALKKTTTETTGLEFKQRIDKATKAISDIAALNSPQEAMASIDQHLANGDIDQQKADMLKNQLAQAPSFNAWQKGMLTNILDAKERLTMTAPKPVQVKRADGSIIFLDENPNSSTFRTEVLPAQAAGMTPFETARVPILKQTANAATLNANTAVAREARLAQGPVGTSLSPEQNDALFGENGAVALGKINPNRINSRNAKMWADAFTRNPNADPVKVAQDVATADKAIKDFGTGPQGVKVTSFNTAIDHLDTLAKLGAAMQNGDVKAFNTISNTLGIQSGQPMATMFNQASRIVGGEISKAIVPGVGTKAEREESANAFNSAMSPEQLKGADAVAKKLLGGQLSSLEQQYKRTTKRSDFAEQLLSPAARAAYQTSRPAEAVAAPTAGVNVVVTPDGQSHTFPTATAAAQFKKAAGL